MQAQQKNYRIWVDVLYQTEDNLLLITHHLKN